MLTFNLTSTIKTKLLNLKNALGRGDDLLTRSAERTLESQLLRNKARIKSGRTRNGQRMQTKSKNRIGAYSARYARQRQALGLPTANMDLRVTGKLIADYQVTRTGSRRVTMGFATARSAKIAGYLEEQQQADIFGIDEGFGKLVFDDFKTQLKHAFGA